MTILRTFQDALNDLGLHNVTPTTAILVMIVVSVIGVVILAVPRRS